MIVPIILLFAPIVLNAITSIINGIISFTNSTLNVIDTYTNYFSTIFDYFSPYIGWIADFLIVPKPILTGFLTFGLAILTYHLVSNITKVTLKIVKELWDLLPVA